jgi:hypothetical protein
MYFIRPAYVQGFRDVFPVLMRVRGKLDAFESFIYAVVLYVGNRGYFENHLSNALRHHHATRIVYEGPRLLSGFI